MAPSHSLVTNWSPTEPYDILPDGLQFVMIQDDPESVPTHMNVVLNWTEELKRLVPIDK